MNWKQAEEQINRALAGLYEPGESRGITQLLLEHITGIEPKEQSQQVNYEFGMAQVDRLEASLLRLKNQEPIQYITGTCWFYGQLFQVNPSVLIPRPETEELVDWIVKTIRSLPAAATSALLDIGTGSGCIAISIKNKLPALQVTALDTCSDALYVATENALKAEAGIDFQLVDFLNPGKWAELPVFDFLVSNPPYVLYSDQTAMRPNVLSFEPHKALFVPDHDPLLFYRAIARFGAGHLQPGGQVFIEIHEKWGEETAELFRSSGYVPVEIRKDMQGKDRMIRAVKANPSTDKDLSHH